MTGRVLKPQPLTREAFGPFGDVIDTDGASHYPINRGTIERFHDLASVDAGDGGRVLVSIVECTRATAFPLPVTVLERHPLGSQAFIPLDGSVMYVVVAPPGDEVGAGDLQAFVSNGRQGVNYRRGTWHMPLVAFEPGLRFVVVDRGGPGENCEERGIDPTVLVERVGDSA